MKKKPQSGREVCSVVEHDDHITIKTTPRRSEAILLYLSGCTLEEVGQRLDITRERVRQYVSQAGIRAAQRVRFKPSVTQEQRRRRLAGPTRRRAERKARIRARMARAVEWLRWYAQSNGRTPNYNQLADALGVPHHGTSAGSALISHFGRKAYEPARHGMRRVHLVYRAAGLTVSRGAPSHRKVAA